MDDSVQREDQHLLAAPSGRTHDGPTPSLPLPHNPDPVSQRLTVGHLRRVHGGRVDRAENLSNDSAVGEVAERRNNVQVHSCLAKETVRPLAGLGETWSPNARQCNSSAGMSLLIKANTPKKKQLLNYS